MAKNLAKNKGNHATRCTILIDDRVYRKFKKLAIDKELKVYEYLNNILAKAVATKVPYTVKHNSVKKTRNEH